MFARVFALLPLALLAAASPSHLEARDSCNSGSITCCNSLQNLHQANGILSQLGLVDLAAQAGAMVGVTCSPITAVGLGSGCQATQQTVCCSNDSFSGAVALGCTPVNIGA